MAIATRDGLAQTEGGAVSEPTGFEIGGKFYDVPRLETFDLDEEQILYDISGLVQMDFVSAHPEATDEVKAAVDFRILSAVRNPAFKRALIHIAYRRQNRDKTFDEIESLIGRASAVDTEAALLRAEKSPPAQSSPKQHESRRSTSDPSRSSDSGTSSGSDSETAAEILPLTGTGR